MSQTTPKDSLRTIYLGPVRRDPPTPEERQQYIGYLDSTDVTFAFDAIQRIGEHGITEAIPKLEELFWKREPLYQDHYLRLLWKLGAPSALSFARALIDSADAQKPRLGGVDPLHRKVLATEVLVDLGDFSTVPLVFELLRREKPRVQSDARRILRPIAQKVSLYADSARTELLRLVREGPQRDDRFLSLIDLVELYGNRMIELLFERAVDDTNFVIRRFAFNKLLIFEPLTIKQFLYKRIFDEPAWSFRSTIADTLLYRYGTPQDYRVVQEYQQWETQPTAKSLTGFRLRDFKPPVPSLITPVSVLLDSLISYKHQVAALGWLGDKNFVNELDNHLENAQNHLVRGDSVNCGKEVEKFQEKVQKEYDKTIDDQKKNKPRDKRFVTVEGWKFLYYHAQYLLDRLPKRR
ncbi:MAG TPA: hypothetical protein VNL36_06165 [Bacteroidota bacterium]|nr:hypothetical protein [Bacteroidota bacterium]